VKFDRLRNFRRFGARLRVGALGEVTHQKRTIYTTVFYRRQSTYVKSRKFAQQERSRPAAPEQTPPPGVEARGTRTSRVSTGGLRCGGGARREGTRTFHYQDISGFCKSATLEEIRKHGYVLMPGRYVGAEAQGDDGEPFEEKMRRLVTQLREQQTEARRLDKAIWKNLRGLGYDA
jgi:hypothetical protein